MKIPNPWPNHPHIRFNVNNGECTGSCGAGPEIEVPDMAVKVLIEPVDRGRYDSNPLAPGRIWSKEYGMLDVKDHLKKMEIKKEEEALMVRQEDGRLRKQERSAQEFIKEKLAEKKEKENQAGINVARAASGLAKVTKALKLKK